jgi:hypothetical protein
VEAEAGEAEAEAEEEAPYSETNMSDQA